VRAVLTGGIYVDPAIVGLMLPGTHARSGRPAAAMPDLTERETEVLKLASLGFTNKEIARRLDVGMKTVETFKSRGLAKLGLKTPAELVRYASARGWLGEV